MRNRKGNQKFIMICDTMLLFQAPEVDISGIFYHHSGHLVVPWIEDYEYHLVDFG